MESGTDISPEARAHDLRHQMALLAVELSLALDRLRGGSERGRASLGRLLDSLEQGLERCRGILGRGESAAAPAGEDRGELLRELWERLERAGRLPDDARLELPRPWRLDGGDEALYSLLLNLLENACEAAGPEGSLLLRLDGEGILVENDGAPLSEALARGLAGGELPEPSGGRGHGLREIRRRAGELGLVLHAEAGSPARIRLSRPSAATLLVVEDDENLRGLLAELCRREGFRVVEAEAFPRQLPEPCHAVLADRDLPGETGDEGLARARRQRAGARTLLFTGDRQALRRPPAGVDRVILKPGLAALREELRRLREDLA